MGSRKNSRFCRATRAETKLRITKNLINSTEVMEIIKNMAFRDFANYGKKRNRTIVTRRREGDLHLGIVSFSSQMERYRKKWIG